MVWLWISDIRVWSNWEQIITSWNRSLLFSLLHYPNHVPGERILPLDTPSFLVCSSVRLVLTFARFGCLWVLITHLFEGWHYPVLSVHAIRCDQDSKTTCNQETKHCQHRHAKEILRLVVDSFRILGLHTLALKRLRTLFYRPTLNCLDRLLRGTDHCKHVEALHEEEARSYHVQDENSLQCASISHQNCSLVFDVAEQFRGPRISISLLLVVLIDQHELLLEFLDILWVPFCNWMHFLHFDELNHFGEADRDWTYDVN